MPITREIFPTIFCDSELKIKWKNTTMRISNKERFFIYLFSWKISNKFSIKYRFFGDTSPLAACLIKFQHNVSTFGTIFRTISLTSHSIWHLATSCSLVYFSSISWHVLWVTDWKPSLFNIRKSWYTCEWKSQTKEIQYHDESKIEKFWMRKWRKIRWSICCYSYFFGIMRLGENNGDHA